MAKRLLRNRKIQFVLRNGWQVARGLALTRLPTAHASIPSLPANNAWLTRNPWFKTELLSVLVVEVAQTVTPASAGL
jgi:hypothetical protein